MPRLIRNPGLYFPFTGVGLLPTKQMAPETKTHFENKVLAPPPLWYSRSVKEGSYCFLHFKCVLRMSSPDVRPGTFHCILQHSPALKSIILELTSVNDIPFLSI